MLLIVYGEYNPEVISAVRSFRAEIYAADGVSVSDELDERSYHVVVYGEGRLAGCLRYTQIGEGAARIGGWWVSAPHRPTRLTRALALAPFRLARALGDTRGIATATTRHGSARLLRKLGGRVTATYWDEGYGCEIERLEFQLSRDPSCARRRRAAGRVEILTGPCQTFDASSRR